MLCVVLVKRQLPCDSHRGFVATRKQPQPYIPQTEPSHPLAQPAPATNLPSYDGDSVCVVDIRGRYDPEAAWNPPPPPAIPSPPPSPFPPPFIDTKLTCEALHGAVRVDGLGPHTLTLQESSAVTAIACVPGLDPSVATTYVAPRSAAFVWGTRTVSVTQGGTPLPALPPELTSLITL